MAVIQLRLTTPSLKLEEQGIFYMLEFTWEQIVVRWSPGQETNNTEIQNTAVGPGGEVELPAPDEVRRAIHSLENNKHLVWTQQAYQQQYIKLEVQLWKTEYSISPPPPKKKKSG